MNQDGRNLVWMDLEMTGLYPDRDRIIEIATIVTDTNLEILAEGPVLAIHQSAAVMESMDDWNTRTHGETGLTRRVAESAYDEAMAAAETLKFLQQYVPRGKSPLCGNSICQDRRFLYRYMPELEQWLHYRNLDVSTVKELATPLGAVSLQAPQESQFPSRHRGHSGIHRRTEVFSNAFSPDLTGVILCFFAEGAGMTLLLPKPIQQR